MGSNLHLLGKNCNSARAVLEIVFLFIVIMSMYEHFMHVVHRDDQWQTGVTVLYYGCDLNLEGVIWLIDFRDVNADRPNVL